MTADPESYRNAAAIATWLGVEQETVRHWARTGVIRGYQPGGRAWLFLASEVAVDVAKSQPRRAAPQPTSIEQKRAQVATGERVTSIRELIRKGAL